MTKRLLSACGLSLLLLSLGAAQVHAQTVAVGPYYAVPSWDQTIACTALANCPRFIVLSNFSNAAVLDRDTGLVWERAPNTASLPLLPAPGQLGVATAHERCVNLNIANHLGWRVPSIQELTSLLDPSQPSPKLPAGHPFLSIQTEGFGDGYWSSTGYQSSSFESVFRFVNFGLGHTGLGSSQETLHVWCVRGGSGEPVQ
jgi:Protein of unknown function (DUF1566)